MLLAVYLEMCGHVLSHGAMILRVEHLQSQQHPAPGGLTLLPSTPMVADGNARRQGSHRRYIMDMPKRNGEDDACGPDPAADVDDIDGLLTKWLSGWIFPFS